MNNAAELGYLEAAQRLVHGAGRRWSQQDLLSAAQRAVLRNTGWPIGLVLTKPGLGPIATPDGVEARVTKQVTGTGEDFWSFQKDGSYYVSRTFEEDGQEHSQETSRVAQRFIWFDVRMWRIAEVILHSAALYRELGIPPDEAYLLTINHQGLQGREFRTSDPRRMVLYQRHCQSPAAAWSREVTQDYATANLHALVGEVANDLFVLFDFAHIDDNVVRELVDDFLRRRL